jgi:hypothetical protein
MGRCELCQGQSLRQMTMLRVRLSRLILIGSSYVERLELATLMTEHEQHNLLTQSQHLQLYPSSRFILLSSSVAAVCRPSLTANSSRQPRRMLGFGAPRFSDAHVPPMRQINATDQRDRSTRQINAMKVTLPVQEVACLTRASQSVLLRPRCSRVGVFVQLYAEWTTRTILPLYGPRARQREVMASLLDSRFWVSFLDQLL